MRRCYLILLVLFLSACSSSTTQDIAPTQTRAAELAQLTQVVATQTRVEELIYLTQVAGTLTAIAPTPTPTFPLQLPKTPTPNVPRQQLPTPTPNVAGQQLPTLTPNIANQPLPTSTSIPRQPATALTATAVAGVRRQATKPGLATFADLALDETRGRLYGTDNLSGRLLVLSLTDFSTIATIDLGQASRPNGLTLSPDGSELAVALTGAGHIALIDAERLTIAGKLYPAVDSGENQPWDVRYAPSGRLYSTGNPGSGGFDYVHVFDTKTRVEIGKSSDIVRAAPRLAIAADSTVFIGESIFSPQQVYRYATQGDIPVQVASGPHGPVLIPDLAVRSDGSAVYTAGGQVWSGNLKSQLGAFTAKGSRLEYVAATERLFICQETTVAQVEATGNYNVVELHPVSATPRVARVNAAGTILYVSTDAGLDVIQLPAKTP